MNMNKEKSKVRGRSRISKQNARSPLTEISDIRHLQAISSDSKRQHDYIPPSTNYDENKKDKFELMNIKIVVYGLTGLVCEQQESKKKQKLGKKETSSSSTKNSTQNEPKLGGHSKPTTAAQASNTTIAVVSCQKNGTSNNISFETFLPSLPLGDPIATSLNKVRYTAAWPSEQSFFQQDEGAKDRSSFAVTRCMKQSTFIPGLGARSNYCHETIELGINISRGTELIRLGTALIVINGEEEGEVEMNIPTTPFVFSNKKLKKKKSKYGYFSNDSSRRFSLDKNSVLRVGVQVIPEEALRFARDKEKKRMKNENQLSELLEQDRFKTILQEMGNDNLDRERIKIKSLPIDPAVTVNGVLPEFKGRKHSFFPYILCGSIPNSWVPNFFKRSETGQDIPTEIIPDHNLDQLVIHSLISSVSDSSEDSDVLQDVVAGEL